MIKSKCLSNYNFEKILLYFIFILFPSLLKAETGNPGKNSEDKKYYKNLYDKVNILSSTVTELKIENVKLKNEIEKKTLDLKLMQSLKFNNSIDGLSLLVGILTFVFTGLVFVVGFSGLAGYKALVRQKDEFEKMKENIKNEVKVEIKGDSEKYINQKVVPDTKDKIKNLEINFWTLTNIARKLENFYWQEWKELNDIELALERNNKFRLAISNILSKNDIDQGLGYLFNLKTTKSLNLLEESLYSFYNYGLFNDYEESFSRLIDFKFHRKLDAWLEKVQKRRQARGDSF